jgi:hypothetical protein
VAQNLLLFSYFACENVSVGAISVSEHETGGVDVFEVEAVLASAQVVRLSRFPLDVIGDGLGRRTGAAPAPGASALVLGAACPVVVVASPVAALGQLGQTLLLGRTVQSQRRHAQTAARLPILLPAHLSHFFIVVY